MSGKDLVSSSSEDRAQLDGRITVDMSVLERSLTKLSAIASEYNCDPAPPYSSELRSDLVAMPRSNVVIQVVGSRGDVQPFIALGLALKEEGHRVRFASHPTFKKLVETFGLEFFSIGGDPAELMAYMVSNPAVIPRLTTFRDGEVRRRTEGISEILLGCWHSCFKICDESESGKDETHYTRPATMGSPFVADLIIANPPSFAHVHCAEKLGVPLHIMFTMPWSPTRAFPHPLVNVKGSRIDPTLINYLSYSLFESITWQGLGSVINKFRSRVLRLDRLGQGSAVGALQRLRVPHTYCWSETLINRPADWNSNMSVAGVMRVPESHTYQPPVSLAKFLESGPPPVYIGFGSIVVDNPRRLTDIIIEALQITRVRALISAGWAKLGNAADNASLHIYEVGDCPHDWLFPQVSCVVHHGGAGTTFAGLAAGKSSVIIPFFGDQLFWGDSVCRAGVGPKPIPWKSLTAEGLAQAIKAALDPQVCAKAYAMGLRLETEDGTQKALQHIEATLPIDKMRCSVLEDHSAAWKVKGSSIRLSAVVMETLNMAGCLQYTDVKLLRACEYDVNSGPWDPISGGSSEIYNLFLDTFKGIAQIGSELAPRLAIEPVVDKRPGSKSVAAYGHDTTIPPTSKRQRATPGAQASKGVTRIVKAATRAPMKFTVAMAQGAHNTPKLWGDKTIRPPVKVSGIASGISAGCQELLYGTYDGITGLVVQPVQGAIDNGVAGFASGIAKGIAGMPVKFWAGMSGIVGYPLQGVDKQIQRAITRDALEDVRSARRAQGAFQYARLNDEDRSQILLRWRTFKD